MQRRKNPKKPAVSWHTTFTESLVCYTFMKQTEYGNDECPVEARSISVFFLCERLIPQREKLEQRKGTGEVTYVTEPVPARSAE